MKVAVVDGRCFLIEKQSDVHDLGLKLLNEWRLMGSLEGRTLEFAEEACDAIDGELAWELLKRIKSVAVVTPESVR